MFLFFSAGNAAAPDAAAPDAALAKSFSIALLVQQHSLFSQLLHSLNGNFLQKIGCLVVLARLHIPGLYPMYWLN